MKNKNQTTITEKSFLPTVEIFFIFILLLSFLTFCSNGENGNDDAVTKYYNVDITYNATFPEVSTYTGEGDATLQDYGDHATIESTITVGGKTFNADFEGVITGDQFSLNTTTFQVRYEFDGVTYTEDITIDFDDFSVAGENLTITGEYEAVTNPGNTTESGTVTIVATKTDEPDKILQGKTITDI